MEPQNNEQLRPNPLAESNGVSGSSDADQLNTQEAELEDEMLQQEYRQRHLEQLRRLQCPGCGETDIF